MRPLLTAIICFLIATIVLAQGYAPKPGETVVKFVIEGRGEVFMKLHTREAPRTTAHIVKLVKSGFYNGLRFHRADRTPKPYLVQVGDPNTKNGDINDARVGTGGSGARIPYEDTGFPNVEGAVGLARVVEDKESGDSQFYVLLGTSKFLDGHYTVFGQIVAGMDIVKKIDRGDRITSAVVLTTN